MMVIVVVVAKLSCCLLLTPRTPTVETTTDERVVEVAGLGTGPPGPPSRCNRSTGGGSWLVDPPLLILVPGPPVEGCVGVLRGGRRGLRWWRGLKGWSGCGGVWRGVERV